MRVIPAKAMLLRFFIVGAVSVLLAACGLNKPVVLPQVSSYTLNNLRSLYIPTTSTTQLTLLVTTPVASPGYQTAQMIYMMTPYKLKAFADNRWVAPPAQMILPLLAQSLRQRGYFYAVVTPPFSGVTNYRLDTNLLVLRQEFLQPTSLIRLVIQASIINNQTNRVIASKHFSVVIKAPGHNPYGGVLATNQAVASIDKKIAAFTIKSVRNS